MALFMALKLNEKAVIVEIIENIDPGKGKSYPGRICTVVNDRLRRKTEIYGGRTLFPYTGTVYGVKR